MPSLEQQRHGLKEFQDPQDALLEIRDGNTLIVNQLASVKATHGLLTVPRVSRV